MLRRIAMVRLARQAILTTMRGVVILSAPVSSSRATEVGRRRTTTAQAELDQLQLHRQIQCVRIKSADMQINPLVVKSKAVA
jgi:hypothetical protein